MAEPVYTLKQAPIGKTNADLHKRLQLFDKHVRIGWGRGLCNDFDAQWLSENGSVQISPSRPNPSGNYIFELRNSEDKKVKVTWLSTNSDVRVEVEGLDYHLFFRQG